MAVLAAGSRLAEQARDHAAETGSGRLAWIAARYVSRLGGADALAAVADDAAWLEHAAPAPPRRAGPARARGAGLPGGRRGVPGPAGPGGLTV